jgi:hypothetical protein
VARTGRHWPAGAHRLTRLAIELVHSGPYYVPFQVLCCICAFDSGKYPLQVYSAANGVPIVTLTDGRGDGATTQMPASLLARIDLAAD